VFNDANGDARDDGGEGALQHSEVYIDSTHIAFPNKRGVFTITDVPPGKYKVRQIPPAGYRQTYPKPSKRSYFAVSVGSNQTVSGLIFGDTNKPAPAVSPAVFSASLIVPNGWEAASAFLTAPAAKPNDLFA
jgi:hypothetical protein